MWRSVEVSITVSGRPLLESKPRNVLSDFCLRGPSDITLDPRRPPRWVNSLMVRRHEELPVRLLAV